MKRGWEIKRLEEIAADIPYPIGDGDHGQIKPKNYSNEGIPYIRVGDMGWGEFIPKNMVYIPETVHQQNLKSKLIPGDILIAKTGATIGKCCIIPDTIIEANTTSSVGKISVDQTKVLPRWVLLFFLTPNFLKFIWSISNRAAQPGFNNRDIKLFKIPLPPISEQQRIVSNLDRCFAAIDKAKTNAEQNLKNAKELFESYLNELFSKVFETNEKKFVSEIAEITGGYSFKSTEFKKDGEYQVIRMGNVRPALIRENESPVFMDNLDEKVLKKALLIPNDVIITQTGSKNKRDYGFTVIIEKHNFLLNQRIARIRFSDKYLPKFFLYFSWTKIFKDQYFANETGTVGQGNVGIGAITDAVIPILTLEEQQKIIERIDALRNESQKIEVIYKQKLQYLDELKKSILQKAFNGELNTENIDL